MTDAKGAAQSAAKQGVKKGLATYTGGASVVVEKGFKAAKIIVPAAVFLGLILAFVLVVGPVNVTSTATGDECGEVYDLDSQVGVGIVTATGVIGEYVDVRPDRPTQPTIVPLGPDPGPTLFAAPIVSAEQAKAYWVSKGKGQPPRLGLPINELIDITWEEATAEGIAADVMFAQMILETGWFTNSDTEINNYAGVGHYDNADSGFAFESPRIGVRTLVQQLKRVVLGNTLSFVNPVTSVGWLGRNSTNHWRTLGDAGYATAPNYGDRLVDQVYAPMLRFASDPAALAAVGSVGGDTGFQTGIADACVPAGLGTNLPVLTPLQGPDCDGLTGRGQTYEGFANGDPNIIARLTKTPNLTTGLQAMAAQQYDLLVAAAVADGFNPIELRAAGYGARTGTYSVHPVGLAVDINSLTGGVTRRLVGEPHPVSDKFESDLYLWMKANAWTFGFCNPRWAKPLYLNGNGSGGHYADGSFAGYEAWHWEFVGGSTLYASPKSGDGSGPLGVPD